MPLLIAQKETPPFSTATVETKQERVLFAFCESDRALFFPSYVEAFPGEGERKWIDTGKLKTFENWKEELLDFRPTMVVSCWSTPPLPESFLVSESIPLRYLCHAAGTVRSKVSREFIASGGIVTNWGNVISHNVAEHALLLILASLRRLPIWRQSIDANNGCWGNAQLMKTNSLREKRVGIHGFGNVARELIRLLAPFDVECRSYSHGVSPSYMKEKGVIPCNDLKELFAKSDIVVECEGLTDQSIGSVTEEHLRLLPEDGVFVNVARGALVDERALERLALEGQIRVACDVFEKEPIAGNSPLLDRENVIVSPHIAGPTGDWFHRCGDHALKNVNRYLKGDPLTGVVTVEVYDRST